MSGHDKVFEKCREKSYREEKEERMLLSVTATAAKAGENSSDEDPEKSEGTGTSEDSKYTETTAGCSSKPSTITSHFPWSVMTSEEICSAADQLSLSVNQTAATVSTVLKTGEADFHELVISASTARYTTINTCHNLCQSYMNDFKETPPDYCTLHLDGKLVKDVFDKTYPVKVLQCSSLVIQSMKEKLLGVPFIESSIGIQQCDVTLGSAWGNWDPWGGQQPF